MRRAGRSWGAVLALLLATACTTSSPPAARPSPSASPSASPSPSAPPAPVVFDAARAFRTIEALSIGIGPREATSASYRRAADLVADSFAAHGYAVRRQIIGVPAGSSSGRDVPDGETQNVIATPPGYDPAAPHLLVGAHLDTVPAAPGANDNASGVAVMMELARLARLEPTGMPVVWVAFGAEERRVPGDGGILYGSRAYLDALPRAEYDALRGVLILDVVGRGSEVLIVSAGTTTPPILDALKASADRLGIAARVRALTNLLSDHRPFERAGFVVGWLYTGPFGQIHTPRDTIAIVDRDALRRVGAIAWDTLRTVSL